MTKKRLGDPIRSCVKVADFAIVAGDVDGPGEAGPQRRVAIGLHRAVLPRCYRTSPTAWFTRPLGFARPPRSRERDHARLLRQSSASNLAAMLVEPTRSQNITVIGRRRRGPVRRRGAGRGIPGQQSVRLAGRCVLARRARASAARVPGRGGHRQHAGHRRAVPLGGIRIVGDAVKEAASTTAISRRVLLVDLDGTLTDPAEGIIGCFRLALAALGRPAPPSADLRWIIGPF